MRSAAGRLFPARCEIEQKYPKPGSHLNSAALRPEASVLSAALPGGNIIILQENNPSIPCTAFPLIPTCAESRLLQEMWTSQIFQNQANSIQADGELVSSLSSDHCMTRLCRWLHGNYVKYLIGLHKMECTFHLAGDLWFFLMVHAELRPPFIPWLITVHF